MLTRINRIRTGKGDYLCKVNNNIVYFADKNGELLRTSDINYWHWLCSKVGHKNVITDYEELEVIDISSHPQIKERIVVDILMFTRINFAGENIYLHDWGYGPDAKPIFVKKANVILILGYDAFRIKERHKNIRSYDVLARNKDRFLILPF